MSRLKLALLVLSMVVAPFPFAPQWLALLGFGTFVPHGEYRASPWLLAIREGLPIAFVLVVAISQRSFWKHRTSPLLFLLLTLFVVTLIPVLLGDLPDFLVLVGLITAVRNIMFFALPVAVYAFLRQPQRGWHSEVVFGLCVAVIVMNFVVAVLQSQLAPVAYESSTAFGAIAVGISTNPNAAGSLMGLGGLLLLLRWRPWWLSMVLCGTFVFGALLTGSRMGIVGTTFVSTAALYVMRQKSRSRIFLVGISVFIFLLVNLTYLSGREESIIGRGGMLGDPRFDLFTTHVGRMDAVELVGGHGLGFATNLSFRWALESIGEGVVPATDSLVTLSILQFGFVGAAFFWVLASWFILTFTSPRAGSIFLAYFLIFGLTQNILEVYPSTILFGVLLGYVAAEWQRARAVSASLGQAVVPGLVKLTPTT